MVKLIEIDGTAVKPTEDILLIEPFRTIWKRDKNNHKTKAINDFKYIYFMVLPSKTNPYMELTEEERSKVIIKEVIGDENYKPDKYVKEAIEVYENWIYEYSFTYKFFQSALKGAEELMKFLSTVDLSERTKGGSAVYKPADITNALRQTEESIKNLENLKKRVFDDIEVVKSKGNKNINPLEL